MTEWRLIKLDFGRSPAHFGELGIGIEETSERVRSDTLFSAWITGYVRLFGGKAVKELLDKFLAEPEPPFRLSSTFIYRIQNGHETFYLPHPKRFPHKYPVGDDMEFSKEYKKLNYLPLDIWKRWYQSQQGFAKDDLESDNLASYKDAYKIDKVPKVSIDRTTRATNFYHTGFVQFRWEEKNKSGLYFLLMMPKADPELEADLKAVLKFLGEEGIGGERSSGAGRFEVTSWENLPKVWKDVVEAPGDMYSLISTFWDSPLDNALLENASYELQERGGWITSPSSGRKKRRKSVQMFIEGSVFPVIPQGKLADVTPDGFDNPHQGGHRVYRSGIALSLPLTI